MLGVGLIAELLTRGLMVPGDVHGPTHKPSWLDVTPAGRVIGEAVIAREQQTPKLLTARVGQRSGMCPERPVRAATASER